MATVLFVGLQKDLFACLFPSLLTLGFCPCGLRLRLAASCLPLTYSTVPGLACGAVGYGDCVGVGQIDRLSLPVTQAAGVPVDNRYGTVGLARCSIVARRNA